MHHVRFSFNFLLSLDWVMSRTTEDRRNGIRWKLTSVLEDLDFADDIALLSSRYVDIEDKTSIQMHETHTENKMATDHLTPTNPGDHRSEQNK